MLSTRLPLFLEKQKQEKRGNMEMNVSMQLRSM